MADRADEFRRHAESCLALARSVTDLSERAKLLIMAQRWYELADEPVDLNIVLQGFNEQQLTTPLAQQPQQQQQQQIQPKGGVQEIVAILDVREAPAA
jgi:hypothetical protein